MKRVGIVAVLALVLSLVVAAPALAQNPHFKGKSGPKPPTREPHST
jgi:hypothetical protein